MPRHTVRKSALRHLVDTFFEGSAEKVVAALLGEGTARLSDDELERIAQRIAKVRKDAQADERSPGRADQRDNSRQRRKDGSK